MVFIRKLYQRSTYCTMLAMIFVICMIYTLRVQFSGYSYLKLCSLFSPHLIYLFIYLSLYLTFHDFLYSTPLHCFDFLPIVFYFLLFLICLCFLSLFFDTPILYFYSFSLVSFSYLFSTYHYLCAFPSSRFVFLPSCSKFHRLSIPLQYLIYYQFLIFLSLCLSLSVSLTLFLSLSFSLCLSLQSIPLYKLASLIW